MQRDEVETWRQAIEVHLRVAHNMYITGALWLCSKGHSLNAIGVYDI